MLPAGDCTMRKLWNSCSRSSANPITNWNSPRLGHDRLANDEKRFLHRAECRTCARRAIASKNARTCDAAMSATSACGRAIATQRVPRSMLLTMNSARRRAARYCQSAFAAVPAARVRGATPMRAAERTACMVLTPKAASRMRRSSATRQAGPVARPQDGLVVLGGSPYRRRLVVARQHAGDGPARREGFEMARAACRAPEPAENTSAHFRWQSSNRACRAAHHPRFASSTADRRSAARAAPCSSAPRPAARPVRRPDPATKAVCTEN